MLFEQNGIGNYFYILKEGSVELIINKKTVKKLGESESFGELALLYQAPRSASVKTLERCVMWVLERKTFRRIVDKLNRMNYDENLKFVSSISILGKLVIRQTGQRTKINTGK